MTDTAQAPSAPKTPSSTAPALTASELLRWNDLTATRWQKLLAAHPEALDFHCGIYGTETVRGLIRHIVAVELRYAQRLVCEPVTAYEEIPGDSIHTLFSLHHDAIEKFRTTIADDNIDWNEKLEFTTLSMGVLHAARRNILFHALLHSIRHYAQLATLVRQQGIKPDWPMDYLFSSLIE